MAKVDERGLLTRMMNRIGLRTNTQWDDVGKELADLREEVAYTADQAARDVWNPDKAEPTQEDYLLATHHSEWYYAAVFMLSNTVAQLPWTLTIEEPDPETGEMRRVEAPENDVTRLLNSPDPVMRATWYATIEATVWYLDTCGNAYWLLWHEKGEEYKEYRTDKEGFYRIRLLRPDKMAAAVDKKTKALTGWVYKPSKKKELLKLDNIVHYMYFNPTANFQGLSPATPAWDSIEALRYFNRHNRRLIENDFSPDPLIVADKDADVSPAQRLDITRKIDSRKKGVNKIGDTFFLPPGTELKQSTSMKDLDFEKLQKVMILNVSAATGVPAALLGLHGQYNLANMKAIRKAFYQDTVMPKTARIADKINSHIIPLLAPELVDKKLRFAFDFSGVEALNEDPKDAAMATKLSTGRAWMSVNEVRDRQGVAAKEDDPSADELYVKPTPGMAPAPVVEEEAEKADERPVWLQIADNPLGDIDKVRAAADPDGFKRWKRMMRKSAPIQRRMVTAIHNGARKERDAVLDELEKQWRALDRAGKLRKAATYGFLKADPMMSKADFERMMNELEGHLEGEGVWMMDALEPEIDKALVAGANANAGMLETGFEFDLLNPEVKKYKKVVGERITTGIPQTTLDKFQNSMWKGWEAGEGIVQLSERVLDQLGFLGGYNDYRAELIARTETIGAFNAGAVDSYRQAKVDGTKHWISAFDARVREWHIDVAAVKGREAPFTVYGPSGAASMMYPGDPAGGGENTVNCRCAVALSPE